MTDGGHLHLGPSAAHANANAKIEGERLKAAESWGGRGYLPSLDHQNHTLYLFDEQ